MLPFTNDRLYNDGTYATQHYWAQIARFIGLTWGISGADRTQVGPMLAQWTLLSGNPRLSSSNPFSLKRVTFSGRNRDHIEVQSGWSDGIRHCVLWTVESCDMHINATQRPLRIANYLHWESHFLLDWLLRSNSQLFQEGRNFSWMLYQNVLLVCLNSTYTAMLYLWHCATVNNLF